MKQEKIDSVFINLNFNRKKIKSAKALIVFAIRIHFFKLCYIEYFTPQVAIDI